MLGINYESSDEEEDAPVVEPQVSPVIVASLKSTIKSPPIQEPTVPTGPVNGPAQGPSASLGSTPSGSTADNPPGSPYTSARSAIRNITLPAVPNFNIPSSPPGSPPLRATNKFAQFLELKKKGQHFNQRLESSTVLRDPGHLQKLMDFAGITEEEQYASVLPKGLAVPTAFPEWAYVEALKESQKGITKSREEEGSKKPREAIDFVPATSSGANSKSGTPSGKNLRQSATERVLAGLDREPRAKRKESEQRRTSPKRKRSRSRDRR
ncbi:hypothetical protein K491DRAFT_742354 [Lophiostoma macrostomum CBS 122681]|uniref:HCNGP-domain-containing protein n=1 Tax=Lophiostoma macrostomum CBS 122681 TaxID=1314788 RepID=A0A6A6TDH1_9PLEO|nr:hypothetical protein K491DRAFT_742354 [Lophiostoma macrostomum CBS 122681]